MDAEYLVIGVGAAGNKAVETAIEEGVVDVDDTILVNSTSKDFPASYNGRTIVLGGKDTGCGKERSISNELIKNSIKDGSFSVQNIQKYTSVIIVGSCEGGTGSGSIPIIAKMSNEMWKRNTHVIVFTGFEDDPRGLANTIEFFKEMKSNYTIHIISNSAFLSDADNNKFKAEKLANIEFAKRVSIITGSEIMSSDQNIDDTDMLKLTSSNGYTIIDKFYIQKPISDQDSYRKTIERKLFDIKSIRTTPGAARLGVILNLKSDSVERIENVYEPFNKEFGIAYEKFTHKQYDGDKEYIAFIVSGLALPIDEIKAIYKRYEEQSAQVNKNNDQFFETMKEMKLKDEDKRFNVIKDVEPMITVDEFLSSL